MDLLSELRLGESTYDQLVTERQQAAAYLQITEEMGPSAQLIAFINYDNQMADELGLESFADLDLETQHVFLSTSLNLEAMDALAVESLNERLHRSAKSLSDVGVFLPGPIGMVARLGTHIALKVTGVDADVFSHRTYVLLVKQFDELLKQDLAVASGAPSSFTKAAWESYFTKINGSKFRRFFLGSKKKEATIADDDAKVYLSESGWSESKLEEALKWYDTSSKRIAALQKNYATKIEGIEKWIETVDHTDTQSQKIMDYISKTLGTSMTIFHETSATLSEIKKVIESVAKKAEKKEA